jgi:hypothetical protein
MCPGEIVPGDEFYSYDDKYFLTGVLRYDGSSGVRGGKNM